MATSAWSNETWVTTDVVAPGGVTDLTKIRWHLNLEGVAVGTSAGGLQGMWPNTRGEVSDTVILDGQNVIEEYLPAGFVFPVGPNRSITGFDDDGECWWRVWQYTPSGFNHNGNVAGQTVRKTMRVKGTPSAITNNVYYSHPPDKVQGGWVYGTSEFNGPDAGLWDIDQTGSNDYTEHGWDCLEIYVKYRKDSTGEMRFWKNGVRIGATINTRTRPVGSNDTGHDFLYVSNWNDGVPQNQTWYWAGCAIAIRDSSRDDTPHMGTDANGFPFIGVAT